MANTDLHMFGVTALGIPVSEEDGDGIDVHVRIEHGIIHADKPGMDDTKPAKTFTSIFHHLNINAIMRGLTGDVMDAMTELANKYPDGPMVLAYDRAEIRKRLMEVINNAATAKN